jgi:hypothetical protein
MIQTIIISLVCAYLGVSIGYCLGLWASDKPIEIWCGLFGHRWHENSDKARDLTEHVYFCERCGTLVTHTEKTI